MRHIVLGAFLALLAPGACTSSEPGETAADSSAPGSGGAQGPGGTPGTGGAGDAGAGGAAGSTGFGGSGSGGVGSGGSGSGGIGSGGLGSGGQGSGGGGGASPLAAKPYLGWSSWSSLVANPTESKIKAIADAVARDLLPYGYQYINIDDGWYNGIDTYGRWKTDTTKIPSGFKGLADYVHGKGLKIGIYLVPGVLNAAWDANSPIEGTSYHVRDIATSSPGNTNTKTSASKKIDFTRPGAVQFIESHAKLLASWGVDFIKMDFVGPGGGGGTCDNREDIKQWRTALDKTGRQIWLELSNKLDIGAISTWKAYSNGWRVASDIEVYSGKRTDWAHVLREINALPPFAQYAGPGGWNDLDSMEVGNGDTDGITPTERQTHFSFWAVTCAPIYLGTDPTVLDASDLKILTNTEILAVQQAGIPAKAVSTASPQQVWYSKQKDGTIVVGLFNLGDATAQVTATFSAIGAASSMAVRDLVAHTDVGRSTASFGASIPAHGSRMLRLTP